MAIGCDVPKPASLAGTGGAPGKGSRVFDSGGDSRVLDSGGDSRVLKGDLYIKRVLWQGTRLHAGA
jgi:hypothetical protein